jgi:hypothetical protein
MVGKHERPDSIEKNGVWSVKPNAVNRVDGV